MSDNEIRPYATHPSGGAGVAPHLTDYWYILTRRVWLVAFIFVITLGTAVWAVSLQGGYFQASLTLQVNDPLERSKPLTAGAGLSNSDIYVDPIQSEIELLKSSKVAQEVVSRLGLRVVSQTPEVPRSSLFSDLWVLEEAVYAEYRLVYREDGGVEIRRYDGTVISEAAVGDSVDLVEFGFTVQPQPTQEREYPFAVYDTRSIVPEVRDNLAAIPRENTNLIDVYYASGDQKLAPLILNTAAEVLREIGAERVRSAAAQDVHFIREQLDSARAKLGQSLREIRDFKESQEFTNLSFQEQNLVNRAQDLSGEQARLERLLEVYRGLAADIEATGPENLDLVRFLAELPSDASGEIRAGAQRIQERQDALDQLLTSDQMTRDHPETRGIIQRIVAEEEGLLASVQAAITVAEANLAQVMSEVAGVRTRQRDFPRLENQLQTLQLQQDLDQSTHQFLLSQLYQSRITASAANAYLVIVDPAVGSAPLSNRRSGYVVLGAILGLMLGVGASLFLEYLDRTVRTSSEVEALLSLPVLGVVPTLRQRGMSLRLPDGKEAPRLAARDPFDSASEAYRNLRLNLTFLRTDDRPLRSILVTSPGPDEGKSTTSLNLAITLAQQGERVVLVDADLRRPTLYRSVEIDREPGLTNLLIRDASTKEVIRDGILPNLDIIPSGSFPPNPSELVASESMRRTLRVLEEKYDRVIVDSPPVLAVTDAAGAAAHVDGILLVLRSGKTEQRAAERAAEQLRRLGLRMLGVALNDVPASAHEESYYLQYQARYLPDSHLPKSRKPGRLRRSLAWVRFR